MPSESHNGNFFFETDTASCSVEPVSDFGVIAIDEQEAQKAASFGTGMDRECWSSDGVSFDLRGKYQACLAQSCDTRMTVTESVQEMRSSRRLMDDITAKILADDSAFFSDDVQRITRSSPPSRPSHRKMKTVVHIVSKCSRRW